MNVRLFGKDVNLYSMSCGANGREGLPRVNKVVNLYTCLTHVCNTNCKFCTFHYKDSETFDIEKWKYCVDEIVEKCGIYKASFTGGEPTLQLDILKECLAYLKDKSEDIFTIVNTNGSNLNELRDLENLDNIALSRHAIEDKDNRVIFGNGSVPCLSEIAEFSDKDKLHLSCNLIKGYIDCDAKVKAYMEMCAGIGVTDVGFVSLMPVNDYAKEKGIDFVDLDLKFSDSFVVNQYFCRKENNKVVCKCCNYLYLAKNKRVVTAYSRFFVDRDSSDGTLVYIDNQLRQGFTGSVVY